MTISLDYISSDRSEARYTLSNVRKGISYGFSASLREAAYEMIPGPAPIGFYLFGINGITDISPQYIQTTRKIAMNISNIKIQLSTNQKSTFFVGNFQGTVKKDLKVGDLRFTDMEQNIINPTNPDFTLLTVISEQYVELEVIFMVSAGTLRDTETIIPISGAGEIPKYIENAFREPSFIRLTAVFSPVENFHFKILEDTPMKGFNSIEYTIKTNGTVQAPSILAIASSIINRYSGQLMGTINIDFPENKIVKKEYEFSEIDQPIEILEITPTIYNSLKEEYNINSIRELVKNKSNLTPQIKEAVAKTLEECGLDVIQ